MFNLLTTYDFRTVLNHFNVSEDVDTQTFGENIPELWQIQDS